LLHSEQTILKACIAGNRKAQAKLYGQYARKMLGTCMWYARNREEAEEILQDGFVRVFTYLHTYSGQGSLEGWIRRIMINAALARAKAGLHLRPVIEYNPAYHENGEEASVIAMMDARELLNLVQSLPPAYRMVFSLYVLEGMKHREIALMLGIAEGTSKSNLSDARAILRKAIVIQQKAAAL
jgi:RNA polymerase sigma-70 factor (ECF subfamily)